MNNTRQSLLFYYINAINISNNATGNRKKIFGQGFIF